MEGKQGGELNMEGDEFIWGNVITSYLCLRGIEPHPHFQIIIFGQLMIRGKRINDVNVKVTLPRRNAQNSAGGALGKCLGPEKVTMAFLPSRDQHQNEQDRNVEEKSEPRQEQPSQSTSQALTQKAFEGKNNQKHDRSLEKQSRNVTLQLREGKAKGGYKGTNQKERKLPASKPTKDPKSTNKNSQTGPTNMKREVQKDIVMEKTTKETRIVESKKEQSKSLSKQLQPRAESLIQLESINQFLQEEEDPEECEEERVYLPIPTPIDLEAESSLQADDPQADSLLLQISFQNNAFDTKLPSAPLNYCSSEQEDSSFEEQKAIDLPPVRCLSFSDESESDRAQQLSLSMEMNSELFSLSAEQLLAKDYFNV